MTELTKEQFQKMFAKKEVNIFSFYRDDCVVCEQYFEGLKNFSMASAIFRVNINQDIIYFKTELGLWVIPSTRVYYEKNIVWESGGILYDTQKKSLLQILLSMEK